MTDTHVDLTNCDREPIHLLGRIQDFGALVAVNADWIVVHHSTNFDAMLDAGTQIAAGMELGGIFRPAAFGQLRSAVGQLRGGDSVERIFGLPLTADGRTFDVAVHLSGSTTIIEFEPHDSVGFSNHVGTLRTIMAGLEGQQDVEPLCREAAKQMKRLLGFDRVMVYKFHEDLSGEVIAEEREPHLERFAGLRYPKTDIPAQARALYLRNPFRIISDVGSDGVPIPRRTSRATNSTCRFRFFVQSRRSTSNTSRTWASTHRCRFPSSCAASCGVSSRATTTLRACSRIR